MWKEEHRCGVPSLAWGDVRRPRTGTLEEAVAACYGWKRRKEWEKEEKEEKEEEEEMAVSPTPRGR